MKTNDAHSLNYERILELLSPLLMENRFTTEDEIRSLVNFVIKNNPDSIDSEGLISELSRRRILYEKHDFTDVFDGEMTNHVEWLPESSDDEIVWKNNGKEWRDIDWRFWNLYKRYLIQNGFPAEDINLCTQKIISRLEDPYRIGNWNSKGMVVGYVQSGKTANYIGLICKAADAGYKLIIILAGTTNDLRAQTQRRIDEGFIGTNHCGKLIGVGKISERDRINGDLDKVPVGVNSLTNSLFDGDFKISDIKTRLQIEQSNVPVCLVVKKNSSILKNLDEWVTRLMEGNTVPNIPLLLIDDEADNASLNTKKYENAKSQGEDDITTINKYIRGILSKFQKSSYVGYTATPYANVFIDPDAKSEKYGSDIFPRNFIITMERPIGYFGSDSVFGVSDSETLFPGIKLVDDDDELIPYDKRNDSSFVPTKITQSLKNAIRSFILATTVREVRNEKKKQRLHNSMLIHISRFISTQGINDDEEDLQSGITKLVRTEIDDMESRLSIKNSSELKTLYNLWETEFKIDSQKIREKIDDSSCTEVNWEQISGKLLDVVRKIQIRTLNGGNKENTLDYSQYEEGLTVIAIGGDRLSRGLTLDGLIVSYFLRSAKSYDSLLQMGRWFGFRFGYVDLCRIYTTKELLLKFRAVNIADEHLRGQFRLMDKNEKTPETYGLKIIQNDPRFRITQQNKMRSGKKQCGNPYSGSLKQTYSFIITDEVINHNFMVVNNFIKEINESRKYERIDDNYVWRDIPAKSIIEHLQNYQCHHGQPVMSSNLYQYISERNHDPNPELISWTVVLINKTSHTPLKSMVADLPIGCTVRNPPKIDGPGGKKVYQQPVDEYSYSKNNITNGSYEEAFDLSNDDLNLIYAEAMADYENGRRKADGKKIRVDAEKPQLDEPNGFYVRCHRPVTKGLLLIYPITWMNRNMDNNIRPIFGLAYSFPFSNNALSDEYISNKIYLRTILGDSRE